MSRFDLQDQRNHPRNSTPALTALIDRALSRRRFLGVGATAGAASFLTLNPLSHAVAAAANSPLLGFNAISASGEDTLRLPQGYRWDVLVSWGDPLFADAPAFSESERSEAAQSRQFGDNNDGMSFFPLAADRALLAINNEYTNQEYLLPAGKVTSLADVRADQAAHGVSIIEIALKEGRWQRVLDSRYTRRITANTPMQLSGPAAGHALLQTQADPSGRAVLGTFNNCANGETPWGTYLTCEENFNGYFGSQDPALALSTAQQRYGIAAVDAGFGWHAFDARFDLAKEPNEANRHGWVVEIDPRDPQSVPKKRTALGRFKHENAALHINSDGRVVVYLGDDERGEHLYKFVSAQRFDKNNPQANRDLLDDGTLYVAQFSAKDGEIRGEGRWLPLVHGHNGLTAASGFADQASVLIHARLAATVVGATTMDRPEWVAVHPSGQQAFCTLTNNKNRGTEGQSVGGPNPRAANHYGQILRWAPAGGDHASETFSWDLFLMAGNPGVHPGTAYAGTANIDADNMFNSPDGIGFDAAGRLWIQTDGDYSNQGDFAGMGNNQMLCADPNSGEVRRFLTGPIACEITGLTFSPDHTAMFVGIQHPGEEKAPSHFPHGGMPRSSVVVITREDGGIIGA